VAHSRSISSGNSPAIWPRLRAKTSRSGCLEGLRSEITALQQEEAQRREAKARLDEECERQAGGLAVVRALQAFMLGKTAEAEALWTTLEALFLWRRKGGRVDGLVGTLFTNDVKQKMLAFFQQLIRDAATK